jgi:hypothetical protein
MPTQEPEEMTDLQMEAAREKLCALCDSKDRESVLEQCAATISRLENFLALDGLERLEAHRQIGGALLRAKNLDAKNFVKWCDKTFGHGREWRCTHMALARRWDDLTRARAWAAVKGLKLANCYSVDGAMDLLRAWDAEKKPEKRRLPKEARTTALGALPIEQSPEQREIEMLRQQLEQQHAEAAHFRIPLPIDVRNRARALAVLVRAYDGEAERELRTIARQHHWFFHDLCEDLGGEESGEPDFAAERSSLETPIVDEESEGEAIAETFADTPKAEQSAPSEETSSEQVERADDDSSLASAAPTALDNVVNATRLEYEPSPGDEGLHGAKPEKAAPPMTGDPPTRWVIVETRKSRGTKRRQVDRWWERNPDRPAPLARDVGKIPR